MLAPPSWVKDQPRLKELENASGKVIPDPAVYSAWFDHSDEKRQRLAVGSRRYSDVQRLTNQDRPSWSYFLDPDSGELVSRERLQAETAADRETRRQEVEKQIARRQALIAHVKTYGFLP